LVKFSDYFLLVKNLIEKTINFLNLFLTVLYVDDWL